MTPRRRLVVLRVTCVFLGVCLLFWLRREAAIPATLRIFALVDAVLDQAVADNLRQTPERLPGRLSRNIVNIDSVAWIQSVQETLSCSIGKGSWEHRIGQGLRKKLHYTLNSSCSTNFGSQLTPPKSEPGTSCSLLRGKNVLLVGPETTFHLHSLWLSALEAHENRSHFCLGPQFCTFHHICQPLSSSEIELPGPEERVKKPPGKQDLVASGSSILRYVLSTTLHASSDPNDAAYTLPVVDPQTGVRVRNAYWLHRARKADIVIMNRGPLPAPAWTYAGDESLGNWTFIDNLHLNNFTAYVDIESFSTRIVNAALHATISTFLPSLLRTLRVIQMDPSLRQKVLVWHASWFLHSPCASTTPTSVPFVDLKDPWSFYYNVQVYMHNHILRDLLPHYGVIFLPQTIPRAPTVQDKANDAASRVDCLRYPPGSTGEKAMEVAFLGGLSVLMEQLL